MIPKSRLFLLSSIAFVLSAVSGDAGSGSVAYDVKKGAVEITFTDTFLNTLQNAGLTVEPIAPATLRQGKRVLTIPIVFGALVESFGNLDAGCSGGFRFVRTSPLARFAVFDSLIELSSGTATLETRAAANGTYFGGRDPYFTFTATIPEPVVVPANGKFAITAGAFTITASFASQINDVFDTNAFSGGQMLGQTKLSFKVGSPY